MKAITKDMVAKIDVDAAVEELHGLAKSDDQEMAHVHADAVLCDILHALGLGAIVEAYESVPKWYA